MGISATPPGRPQKATAKGAAPRENPQVRFQASLRRYSTILALNGLRFHCFRTPRYRAPGLDGSEATALFAPAAPPLDSHQVRPFLRPGLHLRLSSSCGQTIQAAIPENTALVGRPSLRPRRSFFGDRVRLNEMMDELQGEHDCKIMERFRNIPLPDTINACKEWENTPPEQRAARLQRLHRDAQIFNALFYPGRDVVFLMPDCN
ncbi:hypothetical protein CFAM422_005769 [Trichoderma lentiforme]|uniref:Uncharacterized protein n=1 Tax=Trichoderma lentiforme TaxID=1567552 RepID=A0A9P5CC41_9HYPO|nr:hypothetical protein CFAM422_005769 [Trichoderma lentiforme]